VLSNGLFGVLPVDGDSVYRCSPFSAVSEMLFEHFVVVRCDLIVRQFHDGRKHVHQVFRQVILLLGVVVSALVDDEGLSSHLSIGHQIEIEGLLDVLVFLEIGEADGDVRDDLSDAAELTQVLLEVTVARLVVAKGRVNHCD